MSLARWLLALALLLVWANEVPSARTPVNEDPSVLGAKVTRCTTGDGSFVVSPGVHRLTAENSPITVRVADGRIASILTKPLKITPGGAAHAPRLASFTIGAPRAAGGALAFTVSMANLTDCSARVSLAQGVARRGNGISRVADVRFGDAGRADVDPGQKVAGRFAVPLEGDGVYEITASAYAEIGLVR